MPHRYFLDTSALIPCYLRLAAGHVWVEALCSSTTGNVVAQVEITGAEFSSALYQNVRGGKLRRRLCERQIAAFWSDVDAGRYRIIPVTPAVVRRASDLCSIHSLKGYDAVQLAAAMTFRDDTRIADVKSVTSGGPILGDPVFLTEDNRLATAAAAEGFTVDSPLNHP